GFIVGMIIGTAVGFWFGFNAGKDRPLLSNPFAEPALHEKIRESGDNLIEKGGEMLEKGGRALQDKAHEIEPPPPPPQP
ncbi:MAG: hypothetical protein PVJ83_01500, partial [Gammaproteobacteria bacterium]